MHLVYKIRTFSINQKNIYVTNTEKNKLVNAHPVIYYYLKVNINFPRSKSVLNATIWRPIISRTPFRC